MKNDEFKTIIDELHKLKNVQASTSLRNHVQHVLIESLPKKQPTKMSHYFLRLAAWVVIFLGIGSMAVVYGAESANPGDFLYPIKRSVENVQIAMTPDDTQKALLKIKQADERIAEIKQTINKGNPEQMQKIVEDYNHQLDEAVSDAKKVQNKSSTLSQTVNQHLENQTKALEEIENQTSNKNKQVVKKALDSNQQASQRLNTTRRNRGSTQNLDQLKNRIQNHTRLQESTNSSERR
jgi:hypothetical protein